MKLFKSLLVAPATLGLLAPIAATANEVTVNDFNPAIEETLLAGGEGLVEEVSVDDDAFSTTTVMTGRADFQLGGVDNGLSEALAVQTGEESTEAVTATYSYDIDLNTSFTGDDNLYVGIEAGNASANVPFKTDESDSSGDALKITSMFYTFPLGNYTVAVGPKLDSDDAMPTSTSLYSDEFFFGGSAFTLPTNFYTKQGTGSGLAISRVFDNGVNASARIIGTTASDKRGLLTKDGIDVYTLSLGYDADNFGGGVVYQNSDNSCVIAEALGPQVCQQLQIDDEDEGYSSVTLGAYYKGFDKTTISLTSSTADLSFTGYKVDNITDIQVGIDRELGNGTLSASWKTFPFFKIPDLNTPTTIKSDALGSYAEIYYTYNVNDSISIKPGIAFAMPTVSIEDSIKYAQQGGFQFGLLDRTVVGLEATFKF